MKNKPCPNCEMLRRRNQALRSRVLRLQQQLREEEALSARLDQEVKDLGVMLEARPLPVVPKPPPKRRGRPPGTKNKVKNKVKVKARAKVKKKRR